MMEDPDMASILPVIPDRISLQEAMEVPITASLGPVGPLLRKLYYISPEHLDVRPLMVLCMSLKDTSEDEAEASIMSRWWMKIVRELCYDAEDHLDEVTGGRAGAHLDFSELLARAKDASERRQRFQWSPLKTIKPADLISTELPVPVYGRTTVAVEPPKKLVELLALDDTNDDKQAPKVISISGCAGIGKTTVARTLYHNHGGKFQCRAFMIVSQNPDMRAFLTSMLSQLKVPQPCGFPDVPDLIDAVNKHLQGKRYFIVVDDLWTASVWDIISNAFPCGDHCSRIITTTQIDDVALVSCSYDSSYLYKMELLNDHESRKLFFSRVFGSEDGCPTDFKEVSHKIVRKCGGLPLAIVNIASLFASESNMLREKCKHIQDSLPSTSKGMKEVINLMYNSLPRRLRTCLLYLSMYPGGYVIKKDELVKQLVAEGFLRIVVGQDTEEIAGRYFDELVSGGMVQAVDIDNNGEVLSCTVHQMVLDFIRHKSMEDNFIITVDYFQSTLALPDKVRRLSVQFGGVKSAYIPESIVTSYVRSLIFWGFFKCVPCITDFVLLRVLVLHIWADQDKKNFDLTTIGKLFQLKYLKIECNITVKLPGKIRRLQHLGTLQVDARLSAVPSDIIRLESLLHLRLPSQYILPHVVMHMTSLRTLGYFDLNCNSEENVLHLGRLTTLHDLQLTCSIVRPAEKLEKNVQVLGSIIQKLSFLQSVILVPAASGSSCVNIPRDGFTMALSPPDLLLRRIELSRRCCIFFSLPKWFGELKKLNILKIGIRMLSTNDINMLKGLPVLTALTLYVQTISEEKIIIDDGGFQVLTYFKFMCAVPCLSFVQGAMAKVQKLILCFNSIERRSHTFGAVAFSHLTGLTEVSVKLGVRHADNFNIKGVESALKDVVKYHPNTIILIRVQFIDVISYGTTATKGREKGIQEIREGKKKIMEHSEEQDENRQEIHVDNKMITEILEVQEENRLEIIVDTKKITEISEVQAEKQMEIQEDKKGVTERSEEHVNKQDERRYVRTSHTSTSTHTQSFNTVTGAMGPLLSKLLEFLKDEHKLQTNVKNSVQSLHKELEALQDALLEVAKLEPAQLDHVTRIWAKEVRDHSYDADDVVSSLLVQVKGSQGLIARLIGLLSTSKAHHEIADAFTGMMKQTKDLATRRENIVGVHTSSKPNAAGSLFDGKPINDWSKVYNNIGSGSEGGGNTYANNKRKILLLAYYDLPYHLRACLLHLHIFPENYLIKKETLIWKWAAEGLIVEKQGTGLFELGEGYLQELINRNVVLPVEDDYDYGKVIGCRVHAEIIEMICFLSTEEDFVTVLDGSKQCSPVKSKARRLAVQEWTAEQGDPLANIRPESLRSFNAMGCPFRWKLPLSRFKLLRVIAIEECTSNISGLIKHLGKLHQLRYLGLYNTPIEKLPDKIGDLIYLQTLDLRRTGVKELPRGIAQLRQLKCLRTDQYTAIPDWLGNLTSLEELRLGSIFMWPISFAIELAKLTELRELEIWNGGWIGGRLLYLAQSLRKLQKIQVLRLMGYDWSPSGVDELIWGDSDPPGKLRELQITSTRLPAWINVSCVPMLSHLFLNLKSMEDHDLDILGALPELISLGLVLPSSVVLSINGRHRAFPRLRCFRTSVPARFLPGAMPRLEFLRFLGMEAANFAFDYDFVASTLGNLPSLQKVEVEITSRAHYFEVMRAALKRAVEQHPNRPNLRCDRY